MNDLKKVSFIAVEMTTKRLMPGSFMSPIFSPQMGSIKRDIAFMLNLDLVVQDLFCEPSILRTRDLMKFVFRISIQT